MSSKIEKLTLEQIDKLEAEKLEEVTVYTIDFGSYHKFSIADEEIALNLFKLVAGQFFEIVQPQQHSYSDPEFNYRKPVEVKLSAEKKKLWVDQESALRAYNVFKTLSNKTKSKD